MGAPTTSYIEVGASVLTTYQTTGEYVLTMNVTVGPVPPGITLNWTSGLVTTEAGGTDTFTEVLSTGAVTPASSLILAFTPSNWSTPQAVTVTGVDDSVADGDIAYTITVDPTSSLAPEYAALGSLTVSAINVDDDTAERCDQSRSRSSATAVHFGLSGLSPGCGGSLSNPNILAFRSLMRRRSDSQINTDYGLQNPADDKTGPGSH